MQLKTLYKIALSVFLSTLCTSAIAQTADSTKKKSTLKPYSREVKANFLSSYYEQDGNNGAVTGGIGTEQLTNLANVFTIQVPLDSINAVTLYTGADNYSSASTDNIDNDVSSVSSQDVRAFGTVNYNRLNLKRNETYGVKAGFSVEYDYTSFSAGLSYTKEWNDANSELSIVGQAFFDNWSLIYPIELRGRASHPNSARQSYNGQILFSQIINKRLQMGLTGEVIHMSGLLATPFHRVFFADREGADLERLPDRRTKIPVSLRVNYFPFDKLVLRSYYRYYTDDFGITGNTFELEAPIKLSRQLTFSPFFRYHTQTASDYFAPYKEHLSTQEFYTSDFDLSALSSQKMGFGIKYYPLYGLLRSKPFLKSKRVFIVKFIDLRGAYYTRDTGLNAYIGSINIGMSVK